MPKKIRRNDTITFRISSQAKRDLIEIAKEYKSISLSKFIAQMCARTIKAHKAKRKQNDNL